MRKTFLLLPSFLLLMNLAAIGQTNNSMSIIPSIPTSPQAEAFSRYGEYSINYQTGVPDISIPIYEINQRGYKLPVALNIIPNRSSRATIMTYSGMAGGFQSIVAFQERLKVLRMNGTILN